jgi:hypothetical protein
MPSAIEISRLANAAIVAPAGHGKTEIIANVAALGRRALVLTHTHAGVHAIRSRLKRLGVPNFAVSVDTIAGWSMRYAHAFPGIAHPPSGMPQGAEWDQLYRGATQALRVGAIREVVAASYDRILIDEYQDCGSLQHELALALSGIVPTLIFGDPMQGIFEFAEPSLSWPGTIHPHFPYGGTLETPYRWAAKNQELGAWIAETRGKLMRGEVIDLESGPIDYRQVTTAFDMGVFFEGIETREGSFAAIHCHKRLCYQLAKATSGGYQAIEEMAGNRLQSFAVAWDGARNRAEKFNAITRLLDECFQKKQLEPGEATDVDDAAVEAEMNAIAAIGNGIEAVRQYFALSRRRTLWRLFRNEMWRDAERAIGEICAGRAETMNDAVARVRQRTSNSGRKLPKRTISTPLLLKGLEFDHVVIPDATHFVNERQAQAKLFYVAISRATRTLTIGSSSRYLQFPRPLI